MSITSFFRHMKASALFGRAGMLVGQERYEEAGALLKRALDLVPAGEATFADPPAFSTRLSFLKMQSQVAAKINDVPLATAAIREGLAMWLNSGLPPAKHPSFTSWEVWARQYLAWATGQL